MLAIDNLHRDIRYAARGLQRNRSFSTAAILTLALGIGANTAVFSVVNAMIFRPLPARDAHRLAVIASVRLPALRLGPVSFPDLEDYRAATHDIFEDIAGYNVGFSGFAPQGARPDRVLVTKVTGKYRLLFEDPQPYFYVPLAQEYSGLRVLHVRTSLSPEALAPAVEREIHSVEPALPLYDVQPMTKALNSGYGLFAVRTGAFFAAILALLGLSLAVVGLYGMVSYMTSERTHEIGVRVALGANSRNIAVMVIREGAWLTAAGGALGFAGALAVARVLSRMLFGVAPADPASFAVAALCVLVVTVVATCRPARHAARVDPAVALRAE